MLITPPISALLDLDTTICSRFQQDGLLSKNGIVGNWESPEKPVADKPTSQELSTPACSVTLRLTGKTYQTTSTANNPTTTAVENAGSPSATA